MRNPMDEHRKVHLRGTATGSRRQYHPPDGSTSRAARLRLFVTIRQPYKRFQEKIGADFPQ